VKADEEAKKLVVRRRHGDQEAFMVFNFGAGRPGVVTGYQLPADGGWTTLLDSADERWGGPGPEMPAKHHGVVTLRPHSFVVLVRTRE
jgi:hypothetical protein